MKRYGLLITTLSIMLVIIGISACIAGSISDGKLPLRSGTVTLQMKQGWFEDELAWFICTETNDIRCAQTQNLTLAPKLSSALRAEDLAEVFIVTNFQQGPIFSEGPGDSDYSGLVRVNYITWKSGKKPRPITNDEKATISNPNGIPKYDVKVEETDIIFNYPIVAIGQLGGPWAPAPLGFYRIAEGITHNPYKKTITLPTYSVFCSDPVTQRVEIEDLIITDASSVSLANDLGLTYAPGLLDIPASDTQRFWIMKCPKPPSQLPVIEACPDPATWRNSNYDYTPIMKYTILKRYIPESTVVNNADYLRLLLDNYGLTVASQNQRINAPVLFCK